MDNENSKFALLTFQIRENRIVLNTTTKKFDHLPYNSRSDPLDLYLRHDKLWFIRRIDGPYMSPLLRPNEPSWSRDPSYKNLHISYFDLSEECPVEIKINEIKFNLLESPGISSLNWVQDFMVIQLTETKFDLFDLNKCAWSPEAIYYRLART